MYGYLEIVRSTIRFIYNFTRIPLYSCAKNLTELLQIICKWYRVKIIIKKPEIRWVPTINVWFVSTLGSMVI